LLTRLYADYTLIIINLLLLMSVFLIILLDFFSDLYFNSIIVCNWNILITLRDRSYHERNLIILLVFTNKRHEFLWFLQSFKLPLLLRLFGLLSQHLIFLYSLEFLCLYFNFIDKLLRLYELDFFEISGNLCC
jgi:hypothetical protein